MHGENNANVADEVAGIAVVQEMQDGQSAKDDEPIASAPAEEHDYIAINDVFVSGAKKTEKGKKRTVYAPRPERDTKPPAVISVEVDEDEDVEWTWILEDIAYGLSTPGARRYAEAGLAHLARTFGEFA